MIFKRKIYDELLQWKRTDEGRTAVLIQGARRVGKSTIAEEFATNEYETHILVDFAACSTEIRDLFNDVSDLNRIFMRLQLEYAVELKERKSVIIFDEVQLAPKARQAIKYLVKDGRYDYMETGSLISIRKNVRDILIPSEEVKLHMFPMDYEEFRWALGDTTTIRLLQGCFHDKTSLGDATNRKLMRDFRLYMLVGGMPQAVVVYLETNNLEKVDSVKRSIITLYEDDFNKIDPTGNASKIFRQIPAQLTGNANRYLAWSATDGTRNSALAEILSEVRESMVVNMAYHANDPSVGMALHQDPNKYKMFAGDTGLFVIGAFLGDIVETLFCRVTAGVWMSRSSLVWGPFSVVWGLALVLAAILLRGGEQKSESRIFWFGVILGGAYEYVCSAVTELLFGTVFWDYSGFKFNLGGRINLLYCFFWGIAAVTWIRYGYPLVAKGMKAVKRRIRPWMTALLAVFMAVNLVTSALALARYDARTSGAAPANAVDVLLDEHFDNARMERIYPNAKKVEKAG